MAELNSAVEELLAASLDALERYEANRSLADDGTHPPAPGDVYVLNETRAYNVEWVLVSSDPADPNRILAVPADGSALVGSADIELSNDSPLGTFKLRCRFATWINIDLLKPEFWLGALPAGDVAKARDAWQKLAEGELTGSTLARETDDDPLYQDWLEGVLEPARRAVLEERHEAPETHPKRGNTRILSDRIRHYFALAASLLLFMAGAAAWRQQIEIQALESAIEFSRGRHWQEVQQLESKQRRLTVQYQELEQAGENQANSARILQERVLQLNRQLAEAKLAAKVVNPVIAFFPPPEEAMRGRRQIQLRPGASHVVLFLALRKSSPAPSYRLELREKGNDISIWENDRLTLEEPGEVRAGVPLEVLKLGAYELELLELEGNAFRRIAGYEFTVIN